MRWDPAGFVSRELDDRTSAELTPAARLATITAPPETVTDVLAALDLPRYVEVLGPVDVSDRATPASRLVLRATRARGAGLVARAATASGGTEQPQAATGARTGRSR